MTDRQNSFPHKGFPSGWFQIAWVDELEKGDVRPLHYFGRDLVLYRGKSGDFHLLDAFCPHMGAHLGHGGRVQGEAIVCPYHAWMWAGDGRNVAVPSEGKPDPDCRILCWQVVVANEIVWMWFDEQDREPFMPAPVDQSGVSDGMRYKVYPSCAKDWRNLRMRPQYVPENNVDVAHLHTVHKARGPIITSGYEEDDYCLRVTNRITYGYGKKSTRLTPNGPIEVDVMAELWGLGYQYTFFPLPDEAISIAAQTPVDDEHCDMFQTVLVYCDPEEGREAELSEGAAARVHEQFVQIARDIPIWENMKYLENARLTPSEADLMLKVRAWASKFYAAD